MRISLKKEKKQVEKRKTDNLYKEIVTKNGRFMAQ